MRLSPTNLALAMAAALAAVSFFQKGKLPAASAIRPELRQDPRQEPLTERKFSFGYKGSAYEVEPVASYELRGLVVSHNNVEGIADIYHDETSLDTKDLCVIWGENVESEDFHRVKFWSGSFTCYYKYPAGVSFRGDQLSNNHLITDRPEIREKISNVRVGDQVRLAGMLVNYRDMRHPEFTRRTSTERNDNWGGACEVVYVKDIEILKAGTHGWFALFRISVAAFAAVLLLKLLFALYQSHRPGPSY